MDGIQGKLHVKEMITIFARSHFKGLMIILFLIFNLLELPHKEHDYETDTGVVAPWLDMIGAEGLLA